MKQSEKRYCIAIITMAPEQILNCGVVLMQSVDWHHPVSPHTYLFRLLPKIGLKIALWQNHLFNTMLQSKLSQNGYN